MNSTSKVSEPTRYDEQGNESPTGLLVFYSDWAELKQRAEQSEARQVLSGAERDELLESNKRLHLKLAKETIARRAWEHNYMKMGWTAEGARLQTEMLIKEYTDANALKE